MTLGIGIISIRTFAIGSLDQTILSGLMARRDGLHLYREAMLLDRDVAKFRELWRVLAAFTRRLFGYLMAIKASSTNFGNSARMSGIEVEKNKSSAYLV